MGVVCVLVEGSMHMNGDSVRTVATSSPTYNIRVICSLKELHYTLGIPGEISGVPTLVPIMVTNEPKVEGWERGEKAQDQLYRSS